mgnify:CR=1 FL=1
MRVAIVGAGLAGLAAAVDLLGLISVLVAVAVEQQSNILTLQQFPDHNHIPLVLAEPLAHLPFPLLAELEELHLLVAQRLY